MALWDQTDAEEWVWKMSKQENVWLILPAMANKGNSVSSIGRVHILLRAQHSRERNFKEMTT